MIAALVVWAATGCPVATPVEGGKGSPTADITPTATAAALNHEGRLLYQGRRWDDARAKYREALAADPTFLAPQLNIACSFARQERFDEAAAAAIALVQQAYVPWAREILEAADLAALHATPQFLLVKEATARAAADWAAPLAGGVFLLVRTRPAVNLPASGTLVLSLNQEIFAWLPVLGRYRQITAENGQVLAVAQSADGRRLLYVRGGKLVRRADATPTLRGLSVRVLDSASMSLGTPLPIDGDVASVALSFNQAGAALVQIVRDGLKTAFAADGLALVPAQTRTSSGLRGSTPVVLTTEGVATASPIAGRPDCPFRAQNVKATASTGPAVRIVPGRGKPFVLTGPHGLALGGLAFP